MRVRIRNPGIENVPAKLCLAAFTAWAVTVLWEQIQDIPTSKDNATKTREGELYETNSFGSAVCRSACG